MVTKAEFEQLRAETDRRFVEEAARVKAHEAQTQEMLVQTMCEQIAHRMADAHEQLLQQLTDRLTHRDTSPQQDVTPPPDCDFVLTNNRRPTGSGHRPQQDQDHYQLP
jgi:hypothetical protein